MNGLSISAAALILSGCTFADHNKTHVASDQQNTEGYQAKIIRTDFGVPHIYADSLGALSFGNAYAQAQDNICLLADNYIRVNGERSLYHGPDRKETGDNLNLVGDFGFKSLELVAKARELWPGLSADSKEIVLGYVAGYNTYLKDIELKNASLPAACNTAAWVRPIEKEDVLAHLFSIAMIPGIGQFFDELYAASPSHSDVQVARRLIKQQPALGSNAWAIGKENAQNHNSVLLANPHFPYEGSLRFWQVHHTLNDGMDVMGASLIGFPGVVNIGFNQAIAWTHTFSESEHFVLYKMQTGGVDPMHYEIDGEVKHVSKKRVSVKVKTSQGTQSVDRDFYYTDVGPVLVNDDLPWTQDSFFVIKDVNLYNTDMIDHWLALNRSNTIADVQDAFKKYNGLAFNNTLLTSKSGDALYYGDVSVPKLSQLAIDTLTEEAELAYIRQHYGVTVLPGHVSAFIFDGFEDYTGTPKLLNQTYVQNSNDSHWLTNPQTPLTGFSPLFGDEKAIQSLRTRMGLKLLKEELNDPEGISVSDAQKALFSQRAYLSELILSDLKALCIKASTAELSQTVRAQVNAGCDTLRTWDGVFDANSRGGFVFREFAFLLDQRAHFDVPFNVNEPTTTPRQLKQDPTVLEVLARAVANIQGSGLALDTEIGALQFVQSTDKSGAPLKAITNWPGLFEEEGGFNMISSLNWNSSVFPQYQHPVVYDSVTREPLASGLTERGYHIRFGPSWLMVVGFSDQGPEAKGLLTYSQSTHSESAFFKDQTEFYAENKTLRKLPYTKEEVQEAKISTTLVKEHTR
uniref:Aculeacin A acylase n=1 Tax=Pseudoalteromonas rubra TaxID=43658 RepID=A0A0F4QU36_9GAMM|nr:aculeacin A acylase [Pseudoalteromonas rubra]